MRTLTLAGAAILLATSLPAQDASRSERVQFAPGSSSAVVNGTIRGDADVVYLVSARAGQTLRVNMRTANRSTSFGVAAQGADTALFNGSVNGTSFSRQLPTTGDYRITVFLTRNAARRNELANYSIMIGVTDKP
jgi:hypothetical protein